MSPLGTSIQDLTEIASDGFGPVLRGVREGREWTVHWLKRAKRASVSLDAAALLARPAHPAILAVEVLDLDGSVGLAAPAGGRLASSAVAEAGDAPVLSAQRCAEIGAALADASVAAAAARSVTAGLFPLTWKNVHLDRAHPLGVRVFPLWIAATATADLLAHDPADLLFLDRAALRQLPGAGTDAFAIAAILAVLSGVRKSITLPSDAASFLRSVVVSGTHPLSTTALGDGPLAAVLASVVRGGVTPLADCARLAAALREVRADLDPLSRALKLHAAGDDFKALALLHRAAREDASAPLLMLKAALELKQGQRDRALRSVRDARKLAPSSRAALALLGELAADEDEALAATTEAAALDPLSASAQLALAIALERSGRRDEALRGYEALRTLGRVDPSAIRYAVIGAVRISRLILEAGDARLAAAFARSALGPELEPEPRAALLAVLGQALQKLSEFAEALSVLAEAVDIERRNRPGGATTELLNDYAYALVANGRQDEAVVVVRQSLALDPTQQKLLQLLAALRGQ